LELEDDVYRKRHRRGTVSEEDLASGLSVVEEEEERNKPEPSSAVVSDAQPGTAIPLPIPGSRASSEVEREQPHSGTDVETPKAGAGPVGVGPADESELVMPPLGDSEAVTSASSSPEESGMVPEGSGVDKGKDKAVP
jgi:hypothetical protein